LTTKEPIILGEQASGSRTVIEKFEAYGNMTSFAIVLLTPDDFGGANGQPSNARARQNVILELGYFIGKLGRNRVVALTKIGVELPSDLAGLIHLSLDRGGWEQDLAREMRHAGLSVDLNRL
jgi:predicted nucleotide-binding protein